MQGFNEDTDPWSVNMINKYRYQSVLPLPKEYFSETGKTELEIEQSCIWVTS